MSGVETRASVPTPHGSRYLQQLCKHWSHRLEVAFDENAGTVAFPGKGLLTMTAAAEALQLVLAAEDAATAVKLQGVVAEHLDRFAFREGPLAFDWSVVG